MADMTDFNIAAARIPDLEASARHVAKAQAELERARAIQREAIRNAAASRLPETQIALYANVNRMTVRAALGK